MPLAPLNPTMPPTETVQPDANDSVARVAGIYSAYRRSLLYLAVGGWLCLLLGAALRRGPFDPVGVILAVLLFGVLPVVAWLVATTYRVRIDEQGISRRRLGIWTLWPWEDFQQGHVRLNEKDGWLTNFNRPLWDRWWPSAPFLEPAEASFVIELVRRQTPAKTWANDPVVAGVSEVELRLLFYRGVVVSHDGCLWKRSGRLIHWPEISHLRIVRRRVKSQDMYHFELVTHEQKIHGPVYQIRQSGKWISVRHDEDELWLAQLQQLVPPEKFAYVRSHGELRSLEEGTFRLKMVAEQRRALGWLEVAGWGLMAASAIMFGPKIVGWWNVPFLALGWRIAGVVLGVLNAVMPGTLIILVCRYARRGALRQKGIIEEEMAALAGNEADSDVKSPSQLRLTEHAAAS